MMLAGCVYLGMFVWEEWASSSRLSPDVWWSETDNNYTR